MPRTQNVSRYWRFSMIGSVAVDSFIPPVAPLWPPTEQEAIDQALQLVYTENRRLSVLLGLGSATAPALADLRQSPLGVDLQRLADYALGVSDENPEDVLTAIESTLQVLFW